MVLMDNKFKVLLYSHFFYPSLGGLETVSLSLANGFIANGIDCKVITTSECLINDDFAFEVIRKPDRHNQKEIVKWADVVLFNGASLALQPWVLFYRKPFVWVHVGYQASCIDGLGWVDGHSAPITPLASIVYHIKLKGLSWGISEGLRLGLRRFFAKYLVSKNIAITEWMDKMQPLPRQVHIYNPFPVNQFLSSYTNEPEYDFLYLGRIVSEKGVATLLKAFSRTLKKIDSSPRLLMIGEGKWKVKMELLAKDLGIADLVTFAGKKSGMELVQFVSKGKIAIVPSEWYEPMGGVALELMAAGKNLIVSEYGGLKECVGDVGLTFKNGDDTDLANQMLKLLNDQSLRESLLHKGKQRIEMFNPDIFINAYIDLLKEVAKWEGNR